MSRNEDHRGGGTPTRGSAPHARTRAARPPRRTPGAPPRDDATARRAAEIAKTTGLSIEAARQVAAGRADLNDLLKRMVFQDEVEALIAKQALSRALATQVVMGQASLEQILARRRIEAHVEENRGRAVLERALAGNRELTLGLHGHRTLRAAIVAVDQYEVDLIESESKVASRIHKLQIKYAYDPDDHKRVRKGLDYDKSRRDMAVEPVARPQDRYACSDRRLGLAWDRHQVVTAVTVEGECLTGEIGWVARFEFGIRTRGGGEVAVFRHALAELKEGGG